MRMLERSWLVGCLAAAAALVTVACEGGRTPASPSEGVAVSSSAAVQAPKVDVCHAEGNGSFSLTNVNGNALSAHFAHGDAQPGDPVPGVKGKVFDGDCNQRDGKGEVPPEEPPAPGPVSCPCWDSKSLPPVPVDACFNRLPDSLIVSASGNDYIVDLTNAYCAVKSGDPTVRVDPTRITGEQGEACVALLQPLCRR